MKDEMVDVLDVQGNKTGQQLMKSEVHKKGLWHGATHLWIYNSKGEVLLQRRHPDKLLWGNLWDISVAGHIKAGEIPEATMLEEADEELGLSIKADKAVFVGIVPAELPIPPDGWIHRGLNWTYVLKKDLDIKDLTLEEGETSEVRWVSLEGFEKELNDPAKLKTFPEGSRPIWDFGINKMRKLIRK